jgi:molybdate transport system regulatory protein
MEIKYKIWIENNGKVVFGKGRDIILKALHEQRSFKATAKKLGMAFRGVWARIKASEERMGMKLVEIDANQKSSQLTPNARAIMARFEKLEKDMENILHKAHQDFVKLTNDDWK